MPIIPQLASDDTHFAKMVSDGEVLQELAADCHTHHSLREGTEQSDYETGPLGTHHRNDVHGGAHGAFRDEHLARLQPQLRTKSGRLRQANGLTANLR